MTNTGRGSQRPALDGSSPLAPLVRGGPEGWSGCSVLARLPGRPCLSPPPPLPRPPRHLHPAETGPLSAYPHPCGPVRPSYLGSAGGRGSRPPFPPPAARGQGHHLLREALGGRVPRKRGRGWGLPGVSRPRLWVPLARSVLKGSLRPVQGAGGAGAAAAWERGAGGWGAWSMRGAAGWRPAPRQPRRGVWPRSPRAPRHFRFLSGLLRRLGSKWSAHRGS